MIMNIKLQNINVLYKLLLLYIFSTIIAYGSDIFYKSNNHQGTIWDIVTTDNAIYTSSEDGNIIKWDKNGTFLKYLPIDHYWLLSSQTCMIKIDNFLITGSEDRDHSIVAFKDDKFYKIIDKNLYTITGLAVSKDKKYLVAISLSGYIHVYDIKQNFKKLYSKKIDAGNEKTKALYGVGFIDDNIVAIGTWNHELVYFNIKTKKYFKADVDYRINDLKILYHRVIVAGDSHFVNIYDKDGEEISQIDVKQGVKSFALGNKYLVIGNLDGVVIFKDGYVYDTIDAKEVKKVVIDGDHLIFNNDNRLAIYSFSQKRVIFQSKDNIVKNYVLNIRRSNRYRFIKNDYCSKHDYEIDSTFFRNDTLIIDKKSTKLFDQYSGYSVTAAKWIKVGNSCKLAVGTKMGIAYLLNDNGSIFRELQKDYAKIVAFKETSKYLITQNSQGRLRYFSLDEIKNPTIELIPVFNTLFVNQNGKKIKIVYDSFSNSNKPMVFANNFKLKNTNIKSAKEIMGTKVKTIVLQKPISINSLDGDIFLYKDFLIYRDIMGTYHFYNLKNNKYRAIRANGFFKAKLLGDVLFLYNQMDSKIETINLKNMKIEERTLKKPDDYQYSVYKLNDIYVVQLGNTIYYLDDILYPYKEIHIKNLQNLIGVSKKALYFENINSIYKYKIDTNAKEKVFEIKDGMVKAMCNNIIFYTKDKENALYGYNITTKNSLKYIPHLKETFTWDEKCFRDRLFLATDHFLYSLNIKTKDYKYTKITKKRNYNLAIDSTRVAYYDNDYVYIYDHSLQLKQKIPLNAGKNITNLISYKNYFGYIQGDKVKLFIYNDKQQKLIKQIEFKNDSTSNIIFFYNNSFYFINGFDVAIYNLKTNKTIHKKIKVPKNIEDISFFNSVKIKNRLYVTVYNKEMNKIRYFINLDDLSLHKSKKLKEISKNDVIYNKLLKTLTYKNQTFYLNQNIYDFGATKDFIFATKYNLLYVWDKHFNNHIRVSFSKNIASIAPFLDNKVLISFYNGGFIIYDLLKNRVNTLHLYN